MHIDIQLLPYLPDPGLLSKTTVVVIDVLRATSVIVHAMDRGAQEVLAVTKVEEAFKIVKDFPSGTTLLGGERGSRKIEGFNLGNSPKEYTAEKVKEKRLILTTTNGTKAFYAVSPGKEVIAGCFFNIEAVKKRCLELGNDLLIYPSGDEGKFSLEDTVCGGMLIDRILKDESKSVFLTDASLSAHLLYQRFQTNLVEALSLSTHGRDLIEKGFEEDLTYCAQVDITDVVPVFREGVLRIR